MGRRDTGPKSNLQVFQRLNLFESADSRKTLPCLGLIEYSPKDQVSLKTQSDQQTRRVLHRPVELARVTRKTEIASDEPYYQHLRAVLARSTNT